MLGKKKTVKQTDVCANERVVDAMNYTPIDYVHSPMFIDEGISAFRNARKRIKRLPLNNLCEDVLDPTIDSDTRAEIVFGKRQYIKHLGVIDNLIDSGVQEIMKAEVAISYLEEDKAKLEAERDRLLRLI